MRFLVVDDDATNRVVLRALLEKEGHHVVLANDGAQAVAIFDPNAIDMVLMDVAMPVLDGYQATRLIKQNCGDIFIPVLFLTAMSVDEAMMTCVEHGGDDFLTKPYNRTVLCAKISAMNRIRGLYQTVREQGMQVSRLHQHIVREQEVAEKIFSNILKRGDVDLPMVRALRVSAEAFNGDIVLAARNPIGGVNVLVGDFTGHGLAAAIGGMPAADVFYTMTAKGFSIEEIAPEINSKMRQLLPTGRFLSVCLLQVDASCKSLLVWNGGMPDVLVMDPVSREIVLRIPSERLPLGISDPVSFESSATRFEIAPGARLFIYSDGVIETANAQLELYGEKKLIELLKNTDNNERVADTLQAELSLFRAGAVQADDVTFVDIICDPLLMAHEGKHQISDGRTPATNWSAHFEFKDDSLRHIDPLPILMQVVRDMGGYGGNQEDLFLALSELYSNALDHGVLLLDSKLKATADGFLTYYMERDKRLRSLDQSFVKVGLSHRPAERGGELSITVEDSGKGFDWQAPQKELTENLGAKGRGIQLLKRVCASIEYSGVGNIVTATIHWND